MPMSDLDRLWIRHLRQIEVLSNYAPERLPLTNGVIVICCSDGDQFDEFMDHKRDAFKAIGAKPRIHTHALNGGALLASPNCPILQKCRTMELLHEQVRQDISLKGICTVVLSVHAPCGAARIAELDIVRLIAHMINAERALKVQIKDIKSFCVLHVDYGDDTKRTYVVSRERWKPFYHDYLEGNIMPYEDTSLVTDILPTVQSVVFDCS